jgi:predicted nucleic-acid-binding protein
LDTSVVLRLLLGQLADQAARAVAFLDELSRGGHGAVVSDLVVAEACFAWQHHYDVSKQDALLGLRRLFADGEIEPLGAVAGVLATDKLASAKPGFMDRLIHGAYTDAADERVTFEKAAGNALSCSNRALANCYPIIRSPSDCDTNSFL